MKRLSEKCVRCSCLVLLLVPLCIAQEKIRTLENEYPYPNQPIEIVSRQLGDKPFIDEKRVLGGRDWLGKLTLGIKNVTNKNILSFDINILVRKDGTPAMGIPINFRTYTKETENNARTVDGEKKIGVLRPGETAKVRVSDHAMSIFERELTKIGLEDFDRVTVDIRFVYFDDGSRWVMGKELPADAAKPLRPERSQADGALGKSESDKMYEQSGSGRTWGPRTIDWLTDPLESYLKSDLIFPASSRFFFINAKPKRSLVPAPPPSCVWFLQQSLGSRVCFGSHGSCMGNDIECEFYDYASAVTSYDPGGGQLGYLGSLPEICHQPNDPDPPSCSTCQSFQNPYFFPDNRCGQPGTCGQSSTWGCVSPLVSIDGICQQSTTYQSQCVASGGTYIAYTCSCCIPHTCSAQTYWSCEVTPPRCVNDDSPVLIDVIGNGFDLTDSQNGVDFDLNANGVLGHISWTTGASDDAWLALDRNGNGSIDNGGELFGNITAQPDPLNGEERNGFLALAVYDLPGNGGNGDGRISAADSVFNDLRLWQDTNHNGVSESNELHTLFSLGVAQIDLNYRESKRTDQYGNQFRYRSKVRDVHGADIGQWAWDVFLVRQ